MSRPKKIDWFFMLVHTVATRSTCRRRQVGAIITKDDQILSTGYNGAPSGVKDCLVLGCKREQCESGTHHELCRAVHAEQNAIIQAAKHGVSTKDSTMYVNIAPCIICAKMIINAGIKVVVYRDDYATKEGLKMLKEGGVECIQYP